MDAVRWYLQSLLGQPPVSAVVPVRVPTVTAGGLLGRVQLAAAQYCLTVNMVLTAERFVVMQKWVARRARIVAWLAVLDAGDDVDLAVAALASVHDVGDRTRMDDTTTVFDEIQSLADAEARVSADQASLGKAIAFYLRAVDWNVASFTQVLHTCDDAAEQLRVGESAIGLIESYTLRIKLIQELSETGCGTRPMV